MEWCGRLRFTLGFISSDGFSAFPASFLKKLQSICDSSVNPRCVHRGVFWDRLHPYHTVKHTLALHTHKHTQHLFFVQHAHNKQTVGVKFTVTKRFCVYVQGWIRSTSWQKSDFCVLNKVSHMHTHTLSSCDSWNGKSSLPRRPVA